MCKQLPLSCFVLIVMSHGARGSVTGSDHVYVDISEMNELLSPNNFPAMKGRAKIVIIQACAGGETFCVLNRRTGLKYSFIVVSEFYKIC